MQDGWQAWLDWHHNVPAESQEDCGCRSWTRVDIWDTSALLDVADVLEEPIVSFPRQHEKPLLRAR